MKYNRLRDLALTGILLATVTAPISGGPVRAQPVWPGPVPGGVTTTRNAQRAAVTEVRTQAGWLQNATRTAPNYATGGADLVWGQFQALRNAYSRLTLTLNPRQQAGGANEWAELSAGLDIIQEAFTNYQNDLASGRAERVAVGDLCQVLSESGRVWLQQFNQHCNRFGVGS